MDSLTTFLEARFFSRSLVKVRPLLHKEPTLNPYDLHRLRALWIIITHLVDPSAHRIATVLSLEHRDQSWASAPTTVQAAVRLRRYDPLVNEPQAITLIDHPVVARGRIPSPEIEWCRDQRSAAPRAL